MIHRSNFIFCISLFFLLSVNNFSQETKFKIGAILSGQTNTDQTVHARFLESGMNTIVEKAFSGNKDLLSFYDVIPYNQDVNEWIHYYATGLYSKWEAEEDQQASDEVGMKHATGVSAFFNGANCWSSLGTATV